MIAGRVAGSVAGLLAGPFGVAFGFLSGLLVDRAVDQVRFRRRVTELLSGTGDDPGHGDPGGGGRALWGPLRRLWERSTSPSEDDLIRLVGLGVGVAVQDGLVSDADSGAIAAFLRERYLLKAAEAVRIRQALDEAVSVGSRVSLSAVASALSLERLGLSEEEILEYLMLVGYARNGSVGDRRREAILEICEALGISSLAPQRQGLDPHACAVLGIRGDEDLVELRTVYRTLVQQFHPDSAGPLSDHQRRQSNEALVRINQAYETVRAQLHRSSGGRSSSKGPRDP